jgi:hypothetical protein
VSVSRRSPLALAILAGALMAAPARAAAGEPRPQLAPRVRLALAQPPEPYVPPGAQIEPATPPAVGHRPITRQWWFWAAAGAVAAAAVVVVIVASQSSSPPGSTLGDMKAFGGR